MPISFYTPLEKEAHMPESRIEPLFNQVVLQRPTEQKTKGGLFIPETAESTIFTVRAVGPGKFVDGHQFRLEPSVQVGDTVMLDGKAKVSSITVDNERYLVVAEDQILCRIR